ncbi:MAG: phosphopyruvate hydratase [Clostridia bacterium]|nr:phosphopyruvate hydratase [Clostridia bacterium]MBP3653194.1 phosphopyruvate hydratase [Clostridia bacterium]
MKIKDVRARQIFDSRGVPTLEVQVELMDGSTGRGSAPSGASTGIHEAHELRDGGEAYYGKGVSRAIENVNNPIRTALVGMDASRQAAVDLRLQETDGSEDKSRLGGNALIATSWAVADAMACYSGLELYEWLGGVQAMELPCPMFNVINGGGHADNNLEIQEFMFVPSGADSFHEAMRMGSECYHALKKLLHEAGLSTAVGDEGGFAPNLNRDDEALEWMVRAIERAGWRPGEDVCLALDAAAAQWQEKDGYLQPKTKRRFAKGELIEYYAALAQRFPLVSIEDPLGEEDFEGFREITDMLGGEMMIVGDDLFTTNAQRLFQGVALGAANAILIKPNQIGTVSETLHTIQLARRNAYNVIVSHRSGETHSSAIADLAVAVNAEYIKAGAPARSERLAKYNRLLEIENLLG